MSTRLLQDPRLGPEIHCHKMFRDVAQGIARAIYEELAHDNAWYKMYPDADTFVRSCWRNHLEEARDTLVDMLTSGIAEELKIQIHEAIVLDEPLRRRRLAQLARQSVQAPQPE